MQEKIQAKLEKSLAHYVAMPTIPSDVIACSAAMKSLADELKSLGMTVRLDGPTHPWLIATSQPEGMRRKHVKILFAIHFDVVPPENEGQLALRATADKLYGRGVYDMKFAAVCVRQMVADLAAEHSLRAHDIGLLFTTDEEKGGYDGVYDFLKKGWRCDLAVVPDGGWNWSIEARAKGFVYAYLTAYGRSAHSSRPWTGDNPISRLAPALDVITKKFAPTNSDPSAVTVSVNSLETSNEAPLNTTQIPSWAKSGISIRAFTDEELHAAYNFIQETARAFNIDAAITLHDSPVHVERHNPLVKEFIATAEAVRGKPVEFTDAMAASDARHFAKFDIPTVLMYPDGGDHHGPEEWIIRKDLYTYYLLCKQFVQKTARVAAAPQPGAKRLVAYKQLFKLRKP